MKRLGTICMLFSCLTVILVGCTPKFVKRWELENKMTNIYDIYNESSVADLIKKVPRGFSISQYRVEETDKTSYYHTVDLQSDLKNSRLVGKYSKFYYDDKNKEVLLFEYPVEYTDERGLKILSDNELEPFMNNFTFLFETLKINKKNLSQYNLDSIFETPTSSSFRITYSNVKELEKYDVKAPKDSTLLLTLNNYIVPEDQSIHSASVEINTKKDKVLTVLVYESFQENKK